MRGRAMCGGIPRRVMLRALALLALAVVLLGLVAAVLRTVRAIGCASACAGAVECVRVCRGAP